MSAIIIQFPIARKAEPISFSAFVTARCGGKHVVVVKVRRFGGKFGWEPARDHLLLNREYQALAAEYLAETGLAPWAGFTS